jgi:hypothetical protein
MAVVIDDIQGRLRVTLKASVIISKTANDYQFKPANGSSRLGLSCSTLSDRKFYSLTMKGV